MQRNESAHTMRSPYRIGIAGGLLLACSLSIGAPKFDDYAQGIEIEAPSGRALIEIDVPDDLYRTITRADAGDINVFNAEGVTVPHALCSARPESAGVISQQALPVFTLQAATEAQGNPARIDLNTPGGTAVRIEESPAGKTDGSATQTRAHVIDAREVGGSLRSIQFEWRSPGEASEARVRIEASEDLDRWTTVVHASTLLQVAEGDQQLRREKIPLPEQRYRFLRVARADGGPPLVITSVIAERVAEPTTIDPIWFTAQAQASTQDKEWLFDAGRLAPVSYARLRLPQDNMSVRVRIQSRSDPEAQWRERWSGESYSIVADGERRVSAPAHFAVTTDRYWRVLNLNEGAPTPPRLELAYRPARLQFLAQGSGPFTLAFGSRRVAVSSGQACGSLLSDVSGDDLQRYVVEGEFGALRILGGDAALQPPPVPTPVKRIALWVVLVGGVVLLIGMALSLLRRLRPDQST